MELSQYKLTDNIIKSIILYNKAVAEIKTKELDLAIKDLKKALSYNKGFSEAVKLLGLCYVNRKEYRRAKKTFKKLMNHDIYSDLAKEYLNNLKIERNPHQTMDVTRSVKDGSNNKKDKSIKSQYLIGKIVIGLLIVIIVVVGFFITYGVPSKLQTAWKKEQAANYVVDSEEKADGKAEEKVDGEVDGKAGENSEQNTNENFEENNSLSEKNTVSYDEYEDIQRKLEETNLELDNYKNKYHILTMLSDVEKDFTKGNYEKAAGTLINMKNMNFDDETKVKFDKLWKGIKTNYIWTIYNQGNRLYKGARYEEALPKLKIAYEIVPNLELMPWITYQIGVSYKKTNDNANALVYLQKVKDNYPKSNYVSAVESMINQIENKK